MSFFSFLRSKAGIDIDKAEMLEALRADTSIEITPGIESLEIREEEDKRLALSRIMDCRMMLQFARPTREEEKLKIDSHNKLKARLKNPATIYKKRKPTYQKSASSF